MRAARRKAVLRTKQTSEHTLTLMIGVSSLSMWLVFVVVMAGGLYGRSFGALSEERTVWAHRTATGFIDRWFSVLDNVGERDLIRSGTIWVPSAECHTLAIVGLMMAVAGVALAGSRREFSWSSALGLTLIILLLYANTLKNDILRCTP
jgi:hypothetical protein